MTELLQASISGYQDTTNFESFNLVRHLEGDNSAAMQDTDAVRTVGDTTLPAWLVAACRRGDVPVSVLNVALLQRIILHTQVYQLFMILTEYAVIA